MAVPILQDDTAFVTGPSTRLFKTSLIVQGSQSLGFATLYAVSPDGNRFLINDRPQDPGPQISVVLNWTAALKK
jgi:hypothetical protein